MIVVSLEIGHYRCIEDCSIAIGSHAVLVGENGAGKSTILDALRFVLDPDHRTRDDDRNVCSLTRPLEVTVTFGELTSAELEIWEGCVDGSATLRLKKIAVRDENGAWSQRIVTTGLQHDAFRVLRDSLSGNKTTFKSLYNTFAKENSGGYDLATVTRWEDAVTALAAWEASHRDACTRVEIDVPLKTAQTRLAESFSVVMVPAVPKAEDMLAGRNSGIAVLINQMVWQNVLADPNLLDLREKTRARYREIFPVDGPTELDSAESIINESLGIFAPGASFKLGWDPNAIPNINPPGYLTDVVEDGVQNAVELKGHGVQRAVIVSILHALNRRNNANYGTVGDASLAPTTLLLVEEPELYQHPTRARHFARALRGLSSIELGKPGTQVLITTHSPFFVQIADFESVRVVRRGAPSAERSAPKRTVSMTTLFRVAAELKQSFDSPKPWLDERNAFAARLRSVFDADLREGFFADVVVLVEGESDVAAVQGALANRNVDCDAAGIAVLSTGGKNNLDKMLLIFRQLDIPTYVLVDGDNPRDTSDTNIRYMRLLSGPVVPFPYTSVTEKYAIFDADREATLRQEYGPDYDLLMDAACAEFGYERDRVEKVPSIVKDVYAKLEQAGRRSPTLESIADAIMKLSGKAAPSLTRLTRAT